MEIRKPKFELGQKVVDKNGNVETVIGFNSYHFEDNEYWYDVSYDEGTHIKTESFLKPYIEKPKSVWDLKDSDTYYVIDYDVMNVRSVMFLDDTDDINYRELGNCFLTKEEAEFEVERRKVETDMLRLGGRREFKNGENNYYIVCDFNSNYDIYVFNSKSDGFAQMMIYFDSAKECRNAIEKIGEDRIKRYIFKLGISCNEN